MTRSFEKKVRRTSLFKTSNKPTEEIKRNNNSVGDDDGSDEVDGQNPKSSSSDNSNTAGSDTNGVDVSRPFGKIRRLSYYKPTKDSKTVASLDRENNKNVCESCNGNGVDGANLKIEKTGSATPTKSLGKIRRNSCFESMETTTKHNSTFGGDQTDGDRVPNHNHNNKSNNKNRIGKRRSFRRPSFFQPKGDSAGERGGGDNGNDQDHGDKKDENDRHGNKTTTGSSMRSLGVHNLDSENFHHIDNTNVVDDSSNNGSNSDEESQATPIEFRECSEKSFGLSVLSSAEYKEYKRSQRLDSAFFDRRVEEDAERDIVNVKMNSSAFVDKERLNLTEDIYSFVLACSFGTKEMLFAFYVILAKYICYSFLIHAIVVEADACAEERTLNVVKGIKFLMIPVSVAMQEDLITVYYNVANKKYDALVYKRNMEATEHKWVLCNLLRLIDGILSLSANFSLMLRTNEILAVILNFAALHFLQYVDDVMYTLAEKGFFGVALEEATIACKTITFTRRASTGDACNNFITSLDTIFLFLTTGVLYVTYVCILSSVFSVDTGNMSSQIGELAADNPPG